MKRQYAIGRPATYSAPRTSVLAQVGVFLTRALAMPRLWMERQRHTLPHLSDHLLRDMGLQRNQVQTPHVRPYWRG
jgi:uncharacterized protein YjiS (DUF1127 family)